MIKCAKCKVFKIDTEFNKNKQNSGGLEYACRQCDKQTRKERRLNNLEYIKGLERQNTIKRRYGISVEEYDAKQFGICAICNFEGKLHLDHNHDTGKLREFICPNCNLALGLLNEDPERMERMIAYVRKHEREGSK